MKYVFIEANRPMASLRIFCRILGVTKAGYMAWRRQPVGRRRTEDQHLAERIRDIHVASGAAYGSPRIHQELRSQAQPVSRKRVARLMRELGISADLPRRHCVTTNSDHDQPIAANVIDRDFTASAPNQKWATDITYIPTDEGFLYLSAIEDLFSRKIVGWAMDAHMETSLVLRALNMAISDRRPQAGLIHHSDRGSQYASRDYRQRLEDRGITISMSRRANCHDNACAESLWARLKVELVYRRKFRTRDEAKQAIFQYIAVFYNRLRRHSSLGYLSPDDFEAAYHSQPQAAS